jgi:hypothetical protein
MDMRFGTWNVRSIYRIGSLTTVVRKLGTYKLDFGVYRRSDGRSVALNRQRIIHFLWTTEWGSSVRGKFFLT